MGARSIVLWIVLGLWTVVCLAWPILVYFANASEVVKWRDLAEIDPAAADVLYGDVPSSVATVAFAPACCMYPIVAVPLLIAAVVMWGRK